LIDLCHEKKIYPEVKVINADQIEDAWLDLISGNKDGDRYVIDIQNSLHKWKIIRKFNLKILQFSIIIFT